MTALRTNGLEALFAPRSIAVIGATNARGSVGRAVMENLASFPGNVVPVNPKRTTICGRRAYPRVSALPAVPDTAVIITPASAVPEVISECAGAGVRSAIVISAGFKETGEAGRQLEEKMLAAARGTGMRILGPNCLGLMIPHLGLNATFATGMAREGSVAFLSQSGALCTAILDWSLRERVGFSAFVSLGSMLDVGWGDLIDVLGDDPQTKSIVCYIESIGDARSFLSAAREVSFVKPIVLIKVGRTEAAARAAASHTGSMTGRDAVLDAAFQRAGVLRVDTIEELFDLSEVLAKQPRPAGPRLAIVTNAGGPGALATDRLVLSGAQLAELQPKTVDVLDRVLPAAWSHGNPIDVLGAADADLYGRAVEMALADANTDGVLVILTPQAMTDIDGTARRLAEAAKNSAKPILASWMGGETLDTARDLLNGAGIPTYDYPDGAARAFALMWQYSDHQRLLYERPELSAPHEIAGDARETAERIILGVRAAGRTILTEAESKQLLSLYGIPVVTTLPAYDEDEAVRHAMNLGWPVVVKLLSETITHKTDVGGVVLDLRDEVAVRAAWRSIKQAVSGSVGPEHFLGVTVQPMVQRKGIELILGSSVDPQIGPVVLFGSGGELVEIVQDRALALPPLTGNLARRLIERTRIFKALGGVRGQKGIDLPALVQLIVAFSQLVAGHPWIRGIDINPLLATPDQLLALDARIVLHPPTVTESELPRLAIRPYPAEYVSQVRLKDGETFVVRPIRPEDEEMLIAFHGALSQRSVHYRYFGGVSLEARTTHRRLSRICFADYDREMVMVAEHHRDGLRKIVAVARLNRLHRRNEAEFAIVVADAWQGCGLGRQLMQKLVEIARLEKLDAIEGMVLRTNIAMLRVCGSLGFSMQRGDDLEAVTTRLTL